jgi:uncharacterized protein involved in exopolysaccharide biosynthesis
MRWWWLLAIGVVLGAIGAVAYTKAGPTSFTSTALVQVPAQTGTDPTANAAQARSATANYAASGSSTRMYDLVSQALKGKLDVTATDLQKLEQSGALSITPQRTANFFGITVIDKDPDRAELLANTFAQVMVQDAADNAKSQFDARQTQLQQQIDFTRQQLTTAQLYQNQRDLQNQLSGYRTTLLALQSSREQDLARVAATGAPASAQSDVQDILDQQITDVKNNISDVTAQLADVQGQIDKLPAGSDPLLSASFAAAYSQQLADLTTQSVGEQLSAMTSAPPLVQYGDATDAVSTASLKKLGLMGVVLGGGLFAGIAFLIEFIQKRRDRDREDNAREMSRTRIEDLLRTLEEQDITGPFVIPTGVSGVPRNGGTTTHD